MDELIRLLDDGVQRLFSEHGTAAAAHAGWNSSLWERSSSLGLPWLMVPETLGGASGNWLDAYPLLHAMGRYQIPLPIGESMYAARLCAGAGLAIPDGVVTLSAYPRGQLGGPNADRFTGSLHRVPWGRYSDSVVTCVPAGNSLRTLVLRTSEARIVERANLAGEPRDLLIYEDAAALVGGTDDAGSIPLLDQCCLLRLPQIVGCLESALERTTQHASTRKQFGRALADFQAVQQQLAELAAHTAAAACAVHAACAAASVGEAAFQIAAAKLRSNLAIGTATAIAHQVHGAIGMTAEYPLHHATRRLWSWRGEYGNDRHWSARLGSFVAAHGADGFWRMLTERDDVVMTALHGASAG
jgi:acyl-CoA dehydrogenase